MTIHNTARPTRRVLVVPGPAVAFSALWTTQFYPRQPGTGELAHLFRAAFGSGMAASIIRGFKAIRNGGNRTDKTTGEARFS